MTDILIRSVPTEDLDVLRAEAEARHESFQSYMLGILHERAVANRNRAVLSRVVNELKSARPAPVSVEDLLGAKDAPRHGAK